MIGMVVRLLGTQAALVAAWVTLMAMRSLLVATHLLRFVIGAVVVSVVAWLAALTLMLPSAYFVFVAVGIYALWELVHLVRNLKRQEELLPWALPSATRQRIPASVRQVVYYRDKGRCRHCGKGFDLEYRPILPLMQGSSKDVSNIWLVCQPCAHSDAVGPPKALLESPNTPRSSYLSLEASPAQPDEVSGFSRNTRGRTGQPPRGGRSKPLS